MYTVKNFKSKKALKEAISAGEEVRVYQPNNMFNTTVQVNGSVTREGPHYPEPHRWYAQGTLKNGVLVSVK